MDLTLVNDAARAAHLVGLAIGFGVAIVADISAARMLIRPLDARETRALHRFHRMVALGLALFWSSGLVLLWLRTGFDPANFSAKLMTKLGVVTLLTINAILIGRIALPVMVSPRGDRADRDSLAGGHARRPRRHGPPRDHTRRRPVC